MKKFVVSFGKGLIDITAWLWVFIIIFSTIVMAINVSANENAYIILPIVWIVALIALIVFVVTYFLLYLFIDINDSLIEINKKLPQSETLVEQKSKKESIPKINEEKIEYNLSNEESLGCDFMNKGIYKK